MGCGTNIVPGFDAVNKQVKDYPLEMKIMAEFNASESNKNYSPTDKKQSLREMFGDKYKHLDEQEKIIDAREIKDKEIKDKAFIMMKEAAKKSDNIDVVLMNDEIDHQSLSERGAELPRGVEGFIIGADKSSHSTTLLESRGHNGRYYWFLYGGTRGDALKYLLNWGKPTKVTWNETAKLEPSAFYNAREDRIVVRTWAGRAGGGGFQYMPGDVLRMLLHETFHWADYALGRHNYPEAQRSFQPKALSTLRPEFRKAFYQDAANLGLTEFDRRGWWDKPSNEIAEEHDAALAEMIMYDKLLDHPRLIDLGSSYIRSQANTAYTNQTHPLIELGKRFKITNKRTSSLENEYGTEFQLGNFKNGITGGALLKYVDKFGHLPDRFEIKQMHATALRQVALAQEMFETMYNRTSIGIQAMSERNALFEKEANILGYMDILDAMSGGILMDSPDLNYGHGYKYYSKGLRSRLSETFANLGEAWSNEDKGAWNRMKEKLPNLTKEFERIIEENKDSKIAPKVFD